ncbi:MAG: bacteriochlorophyll 4-vinyl reductase [Rhodospirillales bacterium]|nr:bacteriochlorophyll 4-vinyl reductase [Rhodospirillales bacterium]
MADALDAEIGPAATRRLFSACGLAGYLDAAPEHMVDEREVAALHAVIAAELDPETARIVSWSAGARTGDYLLARRIPQAAQRLLRVLPSRLASRFLLAAVQRNAWTFVGSGDFRVTSGVPVRITISGCPICRDVAAGAPRCGYFAATFQRLYRTLVHPKAEVREIACTAGETRRCEFEIRWP